MFTGIVEALGRIEKLEAVGGDVRLTIATDGAYLDGVNLGDSIASNGVCLTAVALPRKAFVADVSVETLDATTARSWVAGTPLNLERALTAHKPLGGHMMSGHVDGVGHLVEKHVDARSWRLTFEAPQLIARYIARKGSIAIDGVSLTVNAVAGSRFEVNIVPHTWENTTLGALVPGSKVNLEVDLIARYLERLLEARQA
ncbi:riboflavin synthase [Nevskia ramosa]|uniref:riboflavin synthase n=1 Tax=Nevskia ramosa TaxID=64002 RepID=UPI0003B5634B|nr:riboflavin synthase [Nevskia ramosa]